MRNLQSLGLFRFFSKFPITLLFRFLSFYRIVLIIFGATLLQGCVVAAFSGAATGAAMVADRRTTGTMIDDQTIELKANQAFIKNKDLWKNSHISALSYNNVLLLVGQTQNEDLKRQITDVVSNIPKIRKIHNEILVGDPTNLVDRSKDSWITAQIKGKMLGSKDISTIRVKVITEDGIVYLMGLTTHDEELAVTEIARNVDGVKKIVQIFEHI